MHWLFLLVMAWYIGVKEVLYTFTFSFPLDLMASSVMAQILEMFFLNVPTDLETFLPAFTFSEAHGTNRWVAEDHRGNSGVV